MFYIIYRTSDGLITQSGSCQSLDQINGHLDGNTAALEVTDSTVNGQTSYVANGIPVAYTSDQLSEMTNFPGPNYTWSPTGWVDGRTLDQAKAAAITRLTDARDELEYANFTYNGNTYTASDTDQRRINGAVTLAMLSQSAGTTFSVTWVDANNSGVNLDGPGVIGLGQALATQVLGAFSRYNTALIAVQAATTNAAVDAINL